MNLSCIANSTTIEILYCYLSSDHNGFMDCLFSMKNRIFDASPNLDFEVQSHELFKFTIIILKAIDCVTQP